MKTKPVAARVLNEVHVIISRRASKQGISVGEYLKKMLTYDALRKR